MANEFTGSVDDRLVRGFRTALARQPTAAEKRSLRRVFDTGSASGSGPADGYLDVATILLNLHETIHRG
jgi:hypothetical protein